MKDLTRRSFVTSVTALTGGAMLSSTATAAPESSSDRKPAAAFRFCLNTATIRGQIQAQKLDIVKQVELTAKAGYDSIEPWMQHLHEYRNGGGDAKDLRKRLADLGVTVESAIGFAQWIVDDDAKRAKGLEDAKRDMDLVAAIGGTRIAAPPAGATREGGLDLFKAAERYRALLEAGDAIGIVPMVEVWGFSRNLSRLGESVFVMIESGHPKAALLGDVYHIYKGGSPLAGLAQIAPQAMPVFHMNDYPADPPRDAINDSHRVWPGDGVAPMNAVLTILARGEKPTVLSLELFNKDYYAMDALDAAKTGLAKMKAAAKQAMG